MSHRSAGPAYRALHVVADDRAEIAVDDLDQFAKGVADTVVERLLPHFNQLEGRLQVLARSTHRKDVDDLWDRPSARLRGSYVPSAASMGGGSLQEALAHFHRQGGAGGHGSGRINSKMPASQYDYSRPLSRPLQQQHNYRPVSARTPSPSEFTSDDSDEDKTLLSRCTKCWALLEPIRTGPLADIVLSGWFSKMSFAVILLNTVFIWSVTNYTALHLKHELPVRMRVIEETFVVYYLCEVTLRLLVHRLFFFWNQDAGWNIFDLVIVSIGLWEVSLQWQHAQGNFDVTFLRVSRIFRVTKILRIFRAFKFMAELQVMLACVLGSIVSLLWACMFNIILLFISALVFVQSMSNYLIDHEDYADAEHCQNMREWFGTVSRAMLSLFMSTTGGIDWGDLFVVVRRGGPPLSLFFIGFIVFFNFAFFNIVTSMFVDKAMKLAKPDEDALIQERKAQEADIDRMLRDLFDQVDTDGSGLISIDELKDASQDELVLHKFQMIDITVRDVQTFFSTLTAMSDSESISVETFVDGCLKMKGPASSLDIQAMRFQVQGVCEDLAKLKAHYGGKDSHAHGAASG